tara:strand:+ start:2777 stop:3328 length:552 start_codon:yes stop_codon:yes gene_type:complete
MIAFVRIPKTASCTILEAIRQTDVVSVDHEPIAHYDDCVATFTFIRDPWERLFSWYRHAKYFQRRTFEQYVLGPDGDPLNPVAPTQFYRHGNADQTTLLIADQEAWFRDRHPTFIGRFENLEPDLRCIGEILGFDVGKVQHLNVSNDTPAHPYDPSVWTPAMLARMSMLFEPFAERYGYTPPC